jgi:hypothetical protein
MAVITGLQSSYAHNQNGMLLDDMYATAGVANTLDEIVIFRSTGPWSKRWLEREYPSKNFHVKGKSSDWGPHAGLVPYDGVYSKVGADADKAAKGTKANDDGLKSRFASKTKLILTRALIDEQLTRPEGSPARTAIESKIAVPGSQDLLLIARRSGDQKQVAFRAFHRRDTDDFEIRVYAGFGGVSASPHRLLDSDHTGAKAKDFEVMASSEVGAGKPMTGDYDLFAICPSWAQYGSRAATDIVKPGIMLEASGGKDRELKKGMAFRAGVGMDNVIDARLHTMGQGRSDAHLKDRQLNWHDHKDRMQIYRDKMKRGETGKLSDDSLQVIFDGREYTEHADMGNLTPRILRCINMLNVEMGAVGVKSALRRVHHNAESHRFRNFAALTAQDMVTIKSGEQYGDGFPLTVFAPRKLAAKLPKYCDVCTLETLHEFKDYAQELKGSPYYVPRNWIWGA